MLYSKKIGIITAYYKEPHETLLRAINSVKALEECGLEVVHYLISDGYPQDLGDDSLVHIQLPESHGDYGDTPRIVGAALAIRDNCYGLMFLDADNILYPQHLKLAWNTHQECQTDLVLAKRRMLREDGSIIPFDSDNYQNITHVDTGCYIFFGEKKYDILKWAKIPNELSVVGDRYFWKMLSGQCTGNVGLINQPTIGYSCLWKDVYLNAGETPPDNAKLLNLEIHDNYLRNLSEEDIAIINKRMFGNDGLI
jgi:hypothetical protein